MEDCIFCKIVKKEAAAKIEYEDDDVVAFANIAPVAETHILIIPKKHVATFMDLDGIVDSMKLAAQKLVSEKGIGEAYKLIFNGGSYQKVHHVHWHLLGGKIQDIKNL